MICRGAELERIQGLLASPKTFPSVLVVGPPQSGKKFLVNEALSKPELMVEHVKVSCLSASIRIADIFDRILENLIPGGQETKCLNFADFVNSLRKLESTKKLVIVFNHAERLRSLDPLLLPGLLKLNELVSTRPITVVLLSRFPWSRWKVTHFFSASPPVQVFLKPYSPEEMSLLLRAELDKTFGKVPDVLKRNFADLVLNTFKPVCRTWPQFKRAAELVWPEYIKPLSSGVDPDNARALYRDVTPHLQIVMSKIHLQEGASLMTEDKSKRLNVELPFFSKFLLLASFLASYNPAKTDKKYFMRSKGPGRVVKKSKRKQQINQRSSQLLGPKAFDLNRMLAIFHVIVDQKVNSSFEILSQIASLVTLQMLTQIGGDLDAPKYKCNVSLDFIRLVAKNVRFELSRYLYDADN